MDLILSISWSAKDIYSLGFILQLVSPSPTVPVRGKRTNYLEFTAMAGFAPLLF